jgi:peptidoglycan/xylan/chitin deacetylase (PgdA/CDA1 family)
MSDQMKYPLPYSERRLPWDDRGDIPVWPDGARMAAVIYITPEEWRWDRHEAFDIRGTPQKHHGSPPERHSLSKRSAVRYAFTAGIPRLLRILDDRDVTISFPTSGLAVEMHPEIMGEVHDAGHEINAHGYSEGTPVSLKDKDGQREDIRETVDLIEDVTGSIPRGWLGSYLECTEETVEVLAEEGFDYHCDLQDDDIPYFIDVGDESLVEIPYRMVGNINDFYVFATRSTRYTPEQVLDYLTSTFDAYYREAARSPMLFNYGTHPFVSGRPEAAQVWANFLDYVLGHDDVWFATYEEIADWWTEQFDEGY